MSGRFRLPGVHKSGCIAALGFALTGAGARAESLAVSEPFEMDEPVPGMGGGPFTSAHVVGGEHGFFVLYSGEGSGTRVDPETGATLDPEGLIIPETGDGHWYNPTFAVSNGEDYLIGGAADYEYPQELVFYCYLADGETMSPKSAVRGLPGSILAAGAIPGGGFVLVWIEYSTGSTELRAVRTDATGALLDDPHGVLLAAGDMTSEVGVAGDASGFVVVYESYGSGPETLHAVRVPADGSAPIVNGYALADEPGYLFDVQVVGTGEDIVALWATSEEGVSRIYAARLDDGEYPPAALLYEAGEEVNLFSIAAAAGDTDLAVVWQEDQGADHTDDLFGAMVSIVRDGDSGLDPGEVFSVSSARREQGSPSIAYSGGAYLVAWEDYRMDAWHIYGARIDGGTVLDPDGLVIASAPNSQWGPLATPCGDGFFAAWADDRHGPDFQEDAVGARITDAGEVLDAPSRTLLSEASADLPVAAIPTDTGCVVYAWDRGSLMRSDVNWVSGEIRSTDSGVTLSPSDDDTLTEAIVVSATNNGNVACLLLDGELFVAGISDSENTTVMKTPLYSPPDADGSHWIDNLMSAASGNTALFIWRHNFAPLNTADYVESTWLAQRVGLSEQGDIAIVGEALLLETPISTVSALGDRFVALHSTGQTARALVIPADPSLPAEVEENLFTAPYSINTSMAVPLDGGLLVVFRSLVPVVPGQNGSLPELYAALLDGSLAVRVPPVEIPGFMWGFTAASNGAAALVLSEVDLYGSTRIVARTIEIQADEPTDENPPGDDSGDTDDGDTDAAPTKETAPKGTGNPPVASGNSVSSGCAAAPGPPLAGFSFVALRAMLAL